MRFFRFMQRNMLRCMNLREIASWPIVCNATKHLQKCTCNTKKIAQKNRSDLFFCAIFLCCMQLFEDIFHNCIVSPPHATFFSSIIYFKPIKMIEYTCSLKKRLKFVRDLKDITFFYYTLLQAELVFFMYRSNCCNKWLHYAIFSSKLLRCMRMKK